MKIGVRNNIRVVIFMVLSTLITIYQMTYYSYPSSIYGILGKVIISLSDISLIGAIFVYYDKTIISMACTGVSELLMALAIWCSNQAKLELNIVDTDGILESFTTDTTLGIGIIISVFILSYRQLRHNVSDGNTGKSILKKINCFKPLEVGVINKAIAIMFYITTVFALANQLQDDGVTILAMGFSLASTFILLLTMVPIRELIYIRSIYYIVWINIIVMGLSSKVTSVISLTEPLIYLTASVISIIINNRY